MMKQIREMGKGKPVFLLLIILFSFLFPGCNTANTSLSKVKGTKESLSKDEVFRWGLMVGKWYGSQPKEGGGRHEWITEHHLDGTYRTTFRECDEENRSIESIEVGEWGISGPVYFSIFKGKMINNEFEPVDPRNPYYKDAYELLEVNAFKMTYVSYASNDKYTIVRVEDKFVLPQCGS